MTAYDLLKDSETAIAEIAADNDRAERAAMLRRFSDLLEALEVHISAEALLDAVLRTRSPEEIGAMVLAAWDRAEAQVQADVEDVIEACIQPLDYDATMDQAEWDRERAAAMNAERDWRQGEERYPETFPAGYAEE